MSAHTLLLTPNFRGRDGIATVARLMAGALEPVDVLALHDPADQDATAGGSPVLGAGGSVPRFLSMALRSAFTPHSIVVVNHVQLAPAALPLMMRGARVISIVHGIEAWTLLTALQRSTLLWSARLIAVSAFSRDRFRAANPQFNGRPIDVCHHGIGPAAAPDTASDDVPAALIVGRMTADERYKGHDALLEIWPSVTDAVPGAQLRVVGDGDDRARLEQKAAALGLTACVTFLGGLDDVSLQAEYGRATGFVMPSPREGFGLVFLEAMRAARCCIGCRGSASEIVVHGETGWIVEPDDRAQLTDAVVQMLRDRAQSAAMGARGRQRYLHHFTEEQFRRRFQALVHAA